MTTLPKEKSAAILTVYKVPAMTKKGRKAIALWLRQNARNIERYGKNYTEGRFTSRYLYQ